jgi:cation transport ATPase
VRLIRANIAFSLALNTVAVLCSILGLLTPVTGALVHNAGSVLVVLNAALLYERRFLTRTSAP